MFTVDVFYDHMKDAPTGPSPDNDCWSTSIPCETKEDVDAFIAQKGLQDSSISWFMVREGDHVESLEWPEGGTLVRNPHWRDSRTERCSEFAMLQGMAHGADAYNEAMGWVVSFPEDDPYPY